MKCQTKSCDREAAARFPLLTRSGLMWRSLCEPCVRSFISGVQISSPEYASTFTVPTTTVKKGKK